MKTKISLFSISLFLSLSMNSFAQKESDIWYFGNNAGLDFNGGAPVAITNGALVTFEGCASISTSTGALRFYTDGITVWNNTHMPMPNGTGLLGDPSATQSGIIVPKPGSSNIYYVFTVANIGGPNGLRYSEVDMSLAGGLGDVTSTKNIPLAPQVTEKITAVKKANNLDIWVIAHDANDGFLVFSVTSAGVNVTPLVSNAGTIDNSIGNLGVGYLKSSPDGSKLVQAISNNSVVDVLNFNTATGVVTSNFTFTSVDIYAYGVEFSPDATRLYVTSWGYLNIYQYDMTLGSSAAIIASATLIGTGTSSMSLGALQNAPDGKIYVAKYGEGFLGYITNPNTLGVGCNFVDNGVSLSGMTSQFGLPNFIQTYFNAPLITFVNTCLGDTTHFMLSDTTTLDSVLWNFNDPSSGTFNTSTFFNPWHIFTALGTYTVSVITHTGAIIDTLTVPVTITGTPVFSIGTDTSICFGTPVNIVLNPGSGYTSYLWQNSTTNQTYTASAAGTYYVAVTNNCGTKRDTMHIVAIPLPTVIVNDTSICAGQTANLTAHGATTYSWSAGATSTSVNTATATPSTTTNYTVTGTLAGCSAKDIATVTVHPLPTPNFTATPPAGCVPFCVQFAESAGTNCSSQLFTFGDGAVSTTSSPSHCYTTPGIYSVTISCTNANNCMGSTTINNMINVSPVPTVNFTMTPQGILKPMAEVFFTGTSSTGSNLSWDFGDSLSGANNTSSLSSPSHIYALGGVYCIKLIATNSGNCSDTISDCLTVVSDIELPNVFTPNGDGKNDLFVIQNLELGVAPIKIYNRWGKVVFESSGYNNDWNGKDVSDGVYYYIMDYPLDNKKYTGFVQVISGK